MIPTRQQCLLLFDRFKLPSTKRIHVEEVARVAVYLAQKLSVKGEIVNVTLVEAAALLHDIDKNIPKQAGERHPDAAVRVLQEMNYAEVAHIVAKHSVHCILNPDTAPKTWEEKLVFLADKMVKHELIGVEHRFKLWLAEQLPETAIAELTQALPKVRLLEQEVYRLVGITFVDMQKDLVSPHL